MRVVVDTNVFVAAGFKPGSAAARVIALVREGRLALVWDAATRRETEAVVRRIPPLRGLRYDDVFAPEGRFDGPVDATRYAIVPDPADRKFAALAAAADAVLVSNDQDLLGVRDALDVVVLTPSELLARLEERD